VYELVPSVTIPESAAVTIWLAVILPVSAVVVAVTVTTRVAVVLKTTISMVVPASVALPRVSIVETIIVARRLIARLSRPIAGYPRIAPAVVAIDPIVVRAGAWRLHDGVRRWRAETFGGEIVAALAAP